MGCTRTEMPKPKERKNAAALEPLEPLPPSMIAMNRSGGFQKTVPKIFWHAAVVLSPIRDTSVPVRNKHENVPIMYPGLFLAYREKSDPFVIPAA